MLKIDMPKPTNCGDCFLCRAGKCEKAYEAYLKIGSMFFKAIYEPDFMLDDCPIEEIDEAQFPKEGEWIVEENDDGGFKWCKWRCSACREVIKKGWQHTKDGEKPKWKYCPNCGTRMKEKQKTESKNTKSPFEYDYCGTLKCRYDIEAKMKGEQE